MTQIAIYTLQLAQSRKKILAEVAKRDGTSLNQFITITIIIAEKLSALDTARFLKNSGNMLGVNHQATVMNCWTM